MMNTIKTATTMSTRSTAAIMPPINPALGLPVFACGLPEKKIIKKK